MLHVRGSVMMMILDLKQAFSSALFDEAINKQDTQTLKQMLCNRYIQCLVTLSGCFFFYLKAGHMKESRGPHLAPGLSLPTPVPCIV